AHRQITLTTTPDDSHTQLLRTDAAGRLTFDLLTVRPYKFGTSLEDGLWRVVVPAHYHNGHEAHFGQVTENFLSFLKDGALPAWETPNMLAKYYVTTQALELAKSKQK
ncbi:MAG: hypothetical protein LBK22_05250, partial [Tannerella sp.]|nr:hypothetical protein [Tannerella sp.]